MKKIDTMFTNGTIYTLEGEGVRKEALCVNQGKIVFTGTTEDALKNYEAGEVVDLKGQTMLPGLGDSHLHFYAYCQTYTTVDLGGAQSKVEVIERLAAKAKTLPEGQWIKGSNFDQSKWNDTCDSLPTRHDLDQASTKHPIVIRRVCLHTAVANTLALEKANIGKGYVYGDGGTVELEENGYPNGVLREQAPRIYDEIIPDPLNVPETKKKIMQKALAKASECGITMIHTYAAEIWKYTEDFDSYLGLDREGKLPLRVTICLDQFYHKPYLSKKAMEDPYRKVQYGSFKIFCDGSFGSRSAKLYEPYHDDPATDGILVINGDDLKERVLKGYEMGLQPAIHAIGDKALDNVLTAIEYTIMKSKENGMTEREQAERLPFRIIHAQLAPPSLVERMSKLPVVLDIQPSFLVTDLHWIEDRIGEERAKSSYPWKTYQNAGIKLLGGSDSPVEDFSPWYGMFAATTRKDLNLFPENGYHPEEKVSIYDAVCMFSKNIPYATGEEDYLGTLEIGKFADMIVIDRDIFERPAEDLINVKVKKTYLAGKEVYSA
ncbi:MAG: amidohydrolase [Anaerovoracaceae bacterium]